LDQNIIPFEKEILTEAQKLNEYIMTSLRTIEGMDLKYIEKNFAEKERAMIENILQKELKLEQFTREEDKIILTDEGKLFGDAISVKLFS
ncbi:MAG TPA: coproporphyrinogen III oxidase, partial [Hanamia sp.]|nr:coproporphyrinogen III oxidase [Hanamia sp.]